MLGVAGPEYTGIYRLGARRLLSTSSIVLQRSMEGNLVAGMVQSKRMSEKY